MEPQNRWRILCCRFILFAMHNKKIRKLQLLYVLYEKFIICEQIFFVYVGDIGAYLL